MSKKTYNVSTTARTARPRSKRLRELGGVSVTVVGGVGGGSGGGGGDTHTHTNKSALDALSIDPNDCLYVSQYREQTQTIETHKVRAGYADEADHAARADDALRAEEAEHAQQADNADKWDEKEFSDYLDQPVRKGDRVQFGQVTTPTLVTPDFTPGGFAGAGAGLTRDANGQMTLEVDNLVARRKLHVNEVIINQSTHVGGRTLFSAANMECVRVVDGGTYWRCYFDTKGGRKANLWKPDDQAYFQQYSPDNTQIVRYYWRLVTSVGEDWINLSKTTCDTGSGIPAEGDNIVQVGNLTDRRRQSMLEVDMMSGGRVVLYAGISTFSFVNRNEGALGVNEHGDPYFYCYGDSLLGDRDLSDPDATYITFQTPEGETRRRMIVSADLHIGRGSSGLTNLSEWQSKQSQIDQAGQDAAEAQGKVDNLQIGGVNLILDGVVRSPEPLSGFVFWKRLSQPLVVGETYIFSTPDGLDDYTELAVAPIYGLGTARQLITPNVPFVAGVAHTTIYIVGDNASNTGRRVKLEDGNKVTAWTAAPEDTKALIDEVKADATAANSAIAAMNDDGILDVSEKHSIRTQWEAIQGVANTTSDGDGSGSYKKAIALAGSKIATATLTALYATLRTYLNNTALYDNVNTLNFVRTTMSGHFKNYYNEQVAVLDRISNGYVDEVQVGGRNYVTNIANWTFAAEDPLSYFRKRTDGSNMMTVYNRTGYSLVHCPNFSRSGLNVFSFDLEMSSAATLIVDTRIQIVGSNVEQYRNNIFFDFPADFKGRVEIRLSGENASNIYIQSNAAYHVFYIGNIKFEKGSKATDWTESPEDAEARLNQVRATAEQSQQRLAQWASDDVISPVEKTGLRQQRAAIEAEYVQLKAEAERYNIATASYDTAYNAAIDALNKYCKETPVEIPLDKIAKDYDHIAAYYTSAEGMRNAVGDVADVSYLRKAFAKGSTEISGGVVLSDFIGVKEGDKVVAGMTKGSVNNISVPLLFTGADDLLSAIQTATWYLDKEGVQKSRNKSRTQSVTMSNGGVVFANIDAGGREVEAMSITPELLRPASFDKPFVDVGLISEPAGSRSVTIPALTNQETRENFFDSYAGSVGNDADPAFQYTRLLGDSITLGSSSSVNISKFTITLKPSAYYYDWVQNPDGGPDWEETRYIILDSLTPTVSITLHHRETGTRTVLLERAFASNTIQIPAISHTGLAKGTYYIQLFVGIARFYFDYPGNGTRVFTGGSFSMTESQLTAAWAGGACNSKIFGNGFLFSKTSNSYCGIIGDERDFVFEQRAGVQGFRVDHTGSKVFCAARNEWIPADRVLYKGWVKGGGQIGGSWAYKGNKPIAKKINPGVYEVDLQNTSLEAMTHYMVRCTGVGSAYAADNRYASVNYTRGEVNPRKGVFNIITVRGNELLDGDFFFEVVDTSDLIK